MRPTCTVEPVTAATLLSAQVVSLQLSSCPELLACSPFLFCLLVDYGSSDSSEIGGQDTHSWLESGRAVVREQKLFSRSPCCTVNFLLPTCRPGFPIFDLLGTREQLYRTEDVEFEQLAEPVSGREKVNTGHCHAFIGDPII